MSLLDKVNSQKPAYTFFLTPSEKDANRKLSKNKSIGQIDGMMALAMAAGVASQMKPWNAAIATWSPICYSTLTAAS